MKTGIKRLYVVRHADALAGEDDAARPLSKKGRRQSAIIGAFLKRSGVSVDAVWQSELLRSQQTAQVIAGKIQSSKPITVKGLDPDASLLTLCKQIDVFRGDLVVVGHAPFLPRLITLLLGLNVRRPIVELKKAGVVCLQTDESGNWTLLWSVEPTITK